MRKLIMGNLFEKKNLNSRYGIYAQTLKDTFSSHQLFRYRIHMYILHPKLNLRLMASARFFIISYFYVTNLKHVCNKNKLCGFLFTHSLLGRRHILRFSISVTYKLVRIIIIPSYVRFACLKFRNHITLSPRKVWQPELSIHKYFFLI